MLLKYTFYKRIFDIIISIVLILLFSPIFIITTAILSVTGEREVLYLQKRIGYKNKSMTIYKFATMLKNSEELGDKDITTRNDFRITKFGKILRITKVNELPQLFNVLEGTMSIVGPRPLMEQGYNRYNKNTKKNIYNILPGITGIGSIYFRDEELVITNSQLTPDETSQRIIAPKKSALELWYQDNMSFTVDIVIIIITAISIFYPSNQILKKVFPTAPI